jgi:hypothetical protein
VCFPLVLNLLDDLVRQPWWGSIDTFIFQLTHKITVFTHPHFVKLVWSHTVVESTTIPILTTGSHGVPSPKAPTFEPREINKIWSSVIEAGYGYFMHNYLQGLCWELSLVFARPTLGTSPKPCLQKALSCRHPCHTWDLGLETTCEVISPNFMRLTAKIARMDLKQHRA